MRHFFSLFFSIFMFSSVPALASKLTPPQPDLKKATFAGGCFWCMEPPFEKLPGVKSVISGFAGGKKKSPSYKEVAQGKTQHVEAVQITYDPKIVSYNDLLEVFWRQVDPTDDKGQFVDKGFQYTTAIFAHDKAQLLQAKKSKSKYSKSGLYKKPIKTRIVGYTNFYPAEAYHQDYYKNHSWRYKYYRYRSGRDEYLEAKWGKKRIYVVASQKALKKKGKKYVKPSLDELKKKLTPLQFKVTQKDGTEPAFKNEFWDNKKPGIYVDVVSGEPLFASTHKYDSGTGWPSFWQPIEKSNIVEKEDRQLFATRTEVRSKQGDSHLGHVFDDGPKPSGLRYCINSAALRFVPLDHLEKEGYAQYLDLFKDRAQASK